MMLNGHYASFETHHGNLKKDSPILSTAKM